MEVSGHHHAWTTLSLGNEPLVLNGLVGPESQSGCFGDQENFLPQQEVSHSLSVVQPVAKPLY